MEAAAALADEPGPVTARGSGNLRFKCGGSAEEEEEDGAFSCAADGTSDTSNTASSSSPMLNCSCWLCTFNGA